MFTLGTQLMGGLRVVVHLGSGASPVYLKLFKVTDEISAVVSRIHGIRLLAYVCGVSKR